MRLAIVVVGRNTPPGILSLTFAGYQKIQALSLKFIFIRVVVINFSTCFAIVTPKKYLYAIKIVTVLEGSSSYTIIFGGKNLALSLFGSEGVSLPASRRNFYLCRLFNIVISVCFSINLIFRDSCFLKSFTDKIRGTIYLLYAF